MNNDFLRSAGIRRTLLAAAACTTLALTGCSGSTGNARVERAEASGDGALKVGLILDSTGSNAFLNAPQLAAVKLAVQEINAAGGLKGKRVELLPTDTGLDTAGQAQALVAAKADVVIGPTDSSHAAAAIDVLSRARTTLISPANTAAGLSAARSGGYYFRTAAADVAQGPVLVKLARDAGAATVAVMHQEGSYGTDLAAAVASSAEQSGLEVAATAGFTAGDAAVAAAAVNKAHADAVIVIARDGTQGALAELGKAGVAGKKVLLSDGAFARYGSRLPAKFLDGARALVPGALPDADFQARLLTVDPGLKDVSFAAEAYDAVTVAALAAARAQDDAGRSIAANLIAVSGGAGEGSTGAAEACTTYKDCRAALMSGPDINYDGESGPLAFDGNGDITSATFTVYTYGADNNPSVSRVETAGRAAG
ncbi:Receptor ligand binding region family protein [Arthrobacter sp. 9AX]|uniref:ABC transporter substrate-binding protein n=1 Tax=Arthrobacter sp. 9AX TaxID=2653131 RepID=UPI0012EF54AA|nr:ABC transporter substrate-binding protein [Arthrobacter sp. 9AX]VXC43484.1 Receptor ligand binding region family protein [Arthrobacter sp. 9AX]